jgi:hypothetical protein
MELELSRETWWQQIDKAPLSPDVVEKLKGAVNAHLNGLIPPALLHEDDYERLTSEVTGITLDGKPLSFVRQEGEVDRLYLQEVDRSVANGESSSAGQ